MKEQDFAYADERFADLQLLRYRLAGFEQLTLQQKKYVYFLAQATLFGRDITTDQGGRWNLDIRKLLEAVYTNYGGDRTEPDFAALTLYLKRLWFSNGIYHHYGCEKFVPGFGEAWLHAAAERLPAAGVPRGYASWADVAAAVAPVVFDPALLPKRVNQAESRSMSILSTGSTGPPSGKSRNGWNAPPRWPRTSGSGRSSPCSQTIIARATCAASTTIPSPGWANSRGRWTS